MISRKFRKHPKATNRNGAAVVEFALIAPLFLLLLAGIIEFGQAYRIEHNLSTASRRGARSAIVSGATNDKVEQKILETLGTAATHAIVEINVNGVPATDISAAEKGDAISITVRLPYSQVGIGFYSNTFSSAFLSSTCTLEHE